VSSAEDDFEAQATRPPRKRRWRAVAVFLSIGVAVALVGWIALQSAGAASRISETMDSVRWWLHGIQLTAIATAWIGWRQGVDWFVRRGSLTPDAGEALKLARHRLMTAVLVIQVFVVMGVPFREPFNL
jgi:hypothetical protein